MNLPKPPLRFELGGLRWEVLLKDEVEMGDCYGKTHMEFHRIELCDNLTPQREQDTYLHEVLHAILASQGRPYGGNVEETYVGALATGLLGAPRTNPELRTWLHEATK